MSAESQALQHLARREAESLAQVAEKERVAARQAAELLRRAAFQAEAAPALQSFRVAPAGCREARGPAKEPAKESAEIAEEIFQVQRAEAVQGMARVQVCAIGRRREAPAEAATRDLRLEIRDAGRTPPWAFAAAARRAEAVRARWRWKPD